MAKTLGTTSFRGFLGNGAWLLVAHTKKCMRQRRKVTPAERERSMVPNRQEQFVAAMRARQSSPR